MRHLALVLWLSACGTSAHPEAPASAPVAASGSAAHEPPPAPSPPVEEVMPADPAPAVEVLADVDAYARVTLSVVNRSSDTTRLSSALSLEREESGAFAARSDAFTIGSELAEDGCLTLAPGAELRATWSCLRADAPGLVRDCARAEDGRYRFVARACRGEARTEGAAFEYRR
jgi:hypothetical protein